MTRKHGNPSMEICWVRVLLARNQTATSDGLLIISSFHFLFHHPYITAIIYPIFYLLKGDYGLSRVPFLFSIMGLEGLSWGYIGLTYWGYIGLMEDEMETATEHMCRVARVLSGVHH